MQKREQKTKITIIWNVYSKDLCFFFWNKNKLEKKAELRWNGFEWVKQEKDKKKKYCTNAEKIRFVRIKNY